MGVGHTYRPTTSISGPWFKFHNPQPQNWAAWVADATPKLPNWVVDKILKPSKPTHKAEGCTSLQNIKSIFSTYHGKITNFALWTAHNCYVTIYLTSKEWCNQAQTAQTGIPSRHQIVQLLASGWRVEPSDCHSRWHLKVRI
ncbi:hypothetical protein VP01_916g6 [Puccinia sorghi]|uniref:Uncharacterized protein n=1 Tax=Puccinia sorghi TaxID=27349 RepID=A0A0L6U7G7_9BASI|nr:hypothetical protein VP01_916g6 [Puccinia sorghi]